jgi:hypothetical protein
VSVDGVSICPKGVSVRSVSASGWPQTGIPERQRGLPERAATRAAVVTGTQPLVKEPRVIRTNPPIISVLVFGFAWGFPFSVNWGKRNLKLNFKF